MAKDTGDENNLKISETAHAADGQKTFSAQKKSEKQDATDARQTIDARGGLKAQTVKPKNRALAQLNPFKNKVVGFIIVVLLFAVIVTTASLIGNAKKSALKAAPVDDYSVIISRNADIMLTVNTQNVVTAQDALNGWDPSGGALYYFNPATATSKWIWSRKQIVTIGKHIFCI